MDAQCNVGVMYGHGVGVEKDPKRALHWFKKAIAQGCAKARGYAGELYETGIGVEKDLGQALHLYTLSAEQGFPEAQFRLGSLYERGAGVKRDLARAAHWYAKAIAKRPGPSEGAGFVDPGFIDGDVEDLTPNASLARVKALKKYRLD